MFSARSCCLVPLVAALALAGCGGTTFKADPAADLALAKGAVLTAADVPGYTGSPHTNSDDTPPAVLKQLSACLHVPASIFDPTPGAQKADSPDFSKGRTQISNTVEIDPNKRDVDAGWSQFSQPGFEACLKDFVEALLKPVAAKTPGAKFGGTTVERFDVGVGDRSVGYAVKISASGPRGIIGLYVDLIAEQRGRAGIDLFYLGVSSPVDRTLEISLAQKVYDRIGSKT